MSEPQVQELLELNRAFYGAFEARDFDAMSDLWEHTDRVTCTHPGWAVLRGWGAVAASWVAMFQGPQQLQFILTDEQVEVAGELGWVTLDENIIGSDAGSTISAINLFARTERGWRMVAHHGSAIVS